MAKQALLTDRSIESLAAASAVHAALLTGLLRMLSEAGRLDKHDLVLIFSTADGAIGDAAGNLAGLGEESSARIVSRAHGTLRQIAKDLGLKPPRVS